MKLEYICIVYLFKLFYEESVTRQQAYPFQNRKFMILPFFPRSNPFNCNISSGVSWKSKICNSKLKK